jgi:hypothetical protein
MRLTAHTTAEAEAEVPMARANPPRGMRRSATASFSPMYSLSRSRSSGVGGSCSRISDWSRTAPSGLENAACICP